METECNLPLPSPVYLSLLLTSFGLWIKQKHSSISSPLSWCPLHVNIYFWEILPFFMLYFIQAIVVVLTIQYFLKLCIFYMTKYSNLRYGTSLTLFNHTFEYKLNTLRDELPLPSIDSFILSNFHVSLQNMSTWSYISYPITAFLLLSSNCKNYFSCIMNANWSSTDFFQVKSSFVAFKLFRNLHYPCRPRNILTSCIVDSTTPSSTVVSIFTLRSRRCTS